MTGREYHWNTADRDIVVRIEESNGAGLLHVDDRTVPFTILDSAADSGWIVVDGQNQRFYRHRDRDTVVVWIGGRTYRLNRVEKGKSLEEAAGSSSGEIRALMPGKVLRIDVAVGDTVTERQSVVIMESMKMESALVASRAGTVKSIHCQVGQVVEMNELLVVIE